jgi:hypothetical protein
MSLEYTLYSDESGPVTAFGFIADLPQGWTYQGLLGRTLTAIFPNRGDTARLELAWIEVPRFPLSFTMLVHVPAVASGVQTVRANAEYRGISPPLESNEVKLDLRMGRQNTLDFISADWNISLQEILRAVQLFSNDAGYSCEAGSEDGYAAGVGNRECAPNDLDFMPQDWHIGLQEILRAVQFYNIGGYYPDADAEDGYAPGQL